MDASSNIVTVMYEVLIVDRVGYCRQWCLLLGVLVADHSVQAGCPDNHRTSSSKNTAKDGNNKSGNANDTHAHMPFLQIVRNVREKYALDVLHSAHL